MTSMYTNNLIAKYISEQMVCTQVLFVVHLNMILLTSYMVYQLLGFGETMRSFFIRIIFVRC